MHRIPLVLSVPLMVWGLSEALLVAPRERTMGDVQRIFYVHLPCALVAGLGFLIAASASTGFLVTGRDVWDRLAQAASEVAVVFTTLVLLTGPLWAKPAWGVYWTWDARLTSTFVLWLLYVGYLFLRQNALDPAAIRRPLAIYSIVAFLDVPFVYYSIQWFRTQHPGPVLGPKGGGLAPGMKSALWICMAAFVCLATDLIARRARLLQLEHEVNEIREAAAIR